MNLIWSFILDFENSANPEIIQNEIFLWRQKASLIIFKNDDIIEKAKTLRDLGFSNKDSLHISAAAEGKADFFITVDKGILNKKMHINEFGNNQSY